MSGRGRGRGRGGMPINYPDGVACKEPEARRYPPLAPPLGYFGRGTLPAHPELTPEDAEMLGVWRRLRPHPVSTASRILSTQRSTDIARDSELISIELRELD